MTPVADADKPPTWRRAWLPTRVLRTELRRSVAPWIALLIAVVGTVTIYAVLRAWGARWMPLALWQRQAGFLLIPIALGAGAWQGGRERRAKVGELLDSTARPRWQRALATAGALATGAVTGYLAMFAAGAVSVAPRAIYFPPGVVLVVAIGALTVVAAVWSGLAAGALWPSQLTPAIAVVAGLVLMIGLPLTLGDTAVGLLSGQLPSQQEDFSRVVTGAHVGQAVWLLGVAATALLLLGATGRRARLGAALPAVLAAAVALAVLPGRDEPLTVTDPVAAGPHCTADAPRVCVRRAHASLLSDLRGPGREALRILAARLPGAPTVVRESTESWVVGARPAPGELAVDLTMTADGHVQESRQELLWQLLDGAGTRPCTNIYERARHLDVHRHHTARVIAAGWLISEHPSASVLTPGQRQDELTTRSLAALLALPPAEQRARVIALRDAAQRCDGRDLLDVLVPPTAGK
jgi:hypothetical protein